MKRIASFIFLVMVGFILVSCTELLTLTTPSVTIEGDVISWEAVENATQYYVYVHDTASTETETEYQTVTDTSYDLSSLSLADGEYSVYVVATNGTEFSANSSAVTYTVGEGGGGELTLSAPVISLTGDTLSWSAVTDATGYTIFIGSTEVDVTTTSYDLTNQSLADGTYSIHVIATAGTVESSDSNAVSYEVSTGSTTLTTPTNVQITANILSWDSVAGADSYRVTVNGVEISVTTTSYDLSQQTLTPGNYDVSVVAVGTNGQSLSATATYTVISTVNVTAIITAILPMLGENYSIGLTLNDFDTAYDFDRYTNTVNLVTAYAEASHDMNLAEADAIGFFTALMALVNDSNDIEQFGLTAATDQFMLFSDMLDATDMFSTYHVTPEIATHLMLEVLDVGITINNDSLSDYLLDVQAMQSINASSIATLKEATEHTDLLDLIANNVPTSSESAAAAIADDDDYSAILLTLFMEIANDHMNDNVGSNDYYYGYTVNGYTIEDDMVDEIVDIVVEIENGDDAAEIDTIYVYHNHVNSLRILYGDSKENAREINKIQNQLTRFTDLQTSLVDEVDAYENSLEMIFEFMITLHDSFPEDVIADMDDLMSGEVLSLTEMVQLKNELVSLLNDAMPTEDDFVMFYETMLMMAGVMTDQDITGLESHADYLGSLHYRSLHLELLFIGDITVTDVTDLMTLQANFETAYGDGGGSPLEDPTALISVLSYFRTYIETFKTNHSDEVDSLEALLNADAFAPLYQEIITQLKNIAVEENPEESDMLSFVFDSLIDEYDEMMVLLGVIDTLGTEFLDTFIDSSASILIAINNLQNSETEDLATMVGFIETIIDEVGPYHTIITNQLTTENIESLLSIAVVPMMVELELYMDETGLTETAIRALIPDLKTVIINIFILEADLYTALEGMDIDTYINQTLGYSEPVDLGSALAIIHLLDEVLTTENETLIDDTIAIVFDDILGASFVSPLLPVDPLELESTRTGIENMIDQLIATIHTFASLDIETLSIEDETAIMQFAYEMNLFMNTSLSRDDQMENATTLTLDVLEEGLYRTDTYFYEFTPTESGYYTFTSTVPELENWYMFLYQGNEMIKDVDVMNGDTLSFTAFLMESQVYYVEIDINEVVYVELDMLVSTTAVTEMTLDTPEDITDIPLDNLYFTYEPTTDGYYEFVVEAATLDEANFTITILDDHGNVIHSNDYTVYEGSVAWYVDAEIGVPLYVELSAFGSTDSFTLTVSEFDGTQLFVDTVQEVAYSGDSQFFGFILPEGSNGFYDITTTSNAELNLYMHIFNNDETVQDSDIYIPAAGSSYVRNYFMSDVLYFIEVSSMSTEASFDMELIPTVIDEVSEDTQSMFTVNDMEEVFYHFNATTADYYQFTFTTDMYTSIEHRLINDEGAECYIHADSLSDVEGLTKRIFLQEGYYTGIFHVDNSTDIGLNIHPQGTPEIALDQELYVDIANDENVEMLFTPEVSGIYKIHSYDNDESDPLVIINWSDELYAQDDDGGGDLNFELVEYFEAGTTYVVRFGSWSGDALYTAVVQPYEHDEGMFN